MHSERGNFDFGILVSRRPDDWTGDDTIGIFSQYGNIIGHRNRGLGIEIFYEHRESVTRAVDAHVNSSRIEVTPLVPPTVTVRSLDAVMQMNNRAFRQTSHTVRVEVPESPEEEVRFRKYLLFRDAETYRRAGYLTRLIVDPDNQEEVSSGNTRVTFIGVDSTEYDVVVKYDRDTDTVWAPL